MKTDKKTFLSTGTLVTPPLSRFPKDNFFAFLWIVMKNRLQCLGSTLGLKIMSQPTIIISRPLLKLGRSSVVPAGKALHVTMSEAVAAGDIATIRSICSPAFAEKLITQIQSRRRGVRAEWHLVSYDNRTKYPRLADFRAVTMPIPGSTRNCVIKQAVVSIASTQEVAQYDETKGNRMVPGSKKQKSLVEHLVLQSKADMTTWKSEPWKLWGTIKESTYESYVEDEQVYLSLMERQGK